MNIVRITLVWLSIAILGALTCAVADPVKLWVPGNVEWFDTGVVVQKGQSVSISAAGLWTNGGLAKEYAGPKGLSGQVRRDTILPAAPLGALVGRVGETTFFVGGYQEVALGGRLLLTMNDVPGTFHDNGGYMAVTLEVKDCGKCSTPVKY